jgi:hypothetical protein
LNRLIHEEEAEVEVLVTTEAALDTVVMIFLEAEAVKRLKGKTKQGLLMIS